MKHLLLAACLVLTLGTAATYQTVQSAIAAPGSHGIAQPSPHPVFMPAVANQPTPTQTPTPTQAPTATPSPTPSPTSTPLPEGVHVLAHRGYRASTSYYVYAELLNTRTKKVCSVEVVGKFYNAAGALVAIGEGAAMLPTLLPQQRTPVQIVVFNAPPSITSYTLEVSWPSGCYWNYQPITVISSNIRNNSGAEVFGEVRNDSDVTVRNGVAVVTFYGPDGNIWSAYRGYISGSGGLAPGQIGVYRILTYNYDDLFTMPFIVQAQS